MNSHVIFVACLEPVKAEVEAYWAKKVPRLRKLLGPFGEALPEIHLTVACHQQNPQSEWYEVGGVIHLPTGSLAARASDKVPRVAVDLVADKLVEEIKRHKEHLRHGYEFKRKLREAVSAAGPVLQRHNEHGRKDQFFRELRPLLRYLYNHARREVRFLQVDVMLPADEGLVPDLLEELVALAWQQFDKRPRHMSLEVWLTDLLHDILEGWIKEGPRQHTLLEERTGADLMDEKKLWAELLDTEETFTPTDLIPEAETMSAWEQLGEKEQKDWLLALLGELPKEQRQAFLLHVLEHYTPAEIAVLQDRDESRVMADIDAARRTLKDRLVAGGYVRNAEPATAETTRTGGS